MSEIHYTTLFTEEALREALEGGLVTKRKHPTFDLWVYNYSSVTQFAWNWNPVTMACRGLVMDGDGFIIARSLTKFFSYDQLEGKVPSTNFVIEEKLDGSMLLAFNYEGQLITATRGSFESDQAYKGYELLTGTGQDVLPPVGTTYVFEVIYPENRIVCSYDYEDVVLLAVVNVDGTEESRDVHALRRPVPFKTPKIYSLKSIDEILGFNEPNTEGFVLKFENGVRVKFKTEEYKRLHRLLTGISNVTIWEYLKDGKDFKELVENVPDEWYNWLSDTKEGFISQYSAIEEKCTEDFQTAKANEELKSRKDFAIFFQQFSYPNILFLMLDDKSHSEAIWKMIKPKWSLPFSKEENDA